LYRTIKVGFYGHSLDDKRRMATQNNDIPDVLKKWTKNREVDNGKSWIADYKEIKDNNYNLSANRYKSATSLELTYEEPSIR
jgi:type I restriction enzyme M protein